MNGLTGMLCALNRNLNWLGSFLPQLALRLFLAYEFYMAGLMKLNGQNWFGGVMDMFPFPLNLVPTDLSWFLATWSELLGGVALALGLGTRFWAAVLIVLDLVAWYTVHATHGYNVCMNGFQLPLMYLLMLLPLMFLGAGKLSLDHWITRYWCRGQC